MIHTVDPKEIQHFSKDSARWWDENGPFKPLHRLNPTRIGYIRDRILAHFVALSGLEILDIGCGGGLVCEPLTRLGAKMTGIDADAQAITVAQDHAAQSGLSITYENIAAEDVTRQYDVVLALEIIEHVTSPAEFVKMVAKLVKPGGLVIFSTLNRTPKAFALGIVAAEVILRWVPCGTHGWKKFVRPAELARACRAEGLTPTDITGLIYKPLSGTFALSKTDLDVNYFLTAEIFP